MVLDKQGAAAAHNLATAKRYVADVLHALKQVGAIVEASPIDGDDPVVATCLTEALFELKILANAGERRLGELRASIIEQARDGSEEMVDIMRFRTQATRARERAEQCVIR